MIDYSYILLCYIFLPGGLFSWRFFFRVQRALGQGFLARFFFHVPSLIYLCHTKEAIRKIEYKQTMWRVYRRTKKDEDYTNYKETFNAATTEIRQSRRNYEQKLPCNIKN